MKHRFLIATLVLFVLQPLHVLADEFEYLINDLETLEEELQMHQQDEDIAEADVLYEEEQSLFPKEKIEIEASEDAGRNYEVSDTHVYIRDNGIPVILNDVPLSEWFAPYVREMAERGIISGYKDESGNLRGAYGPGDRVTIAQLAKIVIEASSTDQEACPESPINTAAQSHWASQYVSCAEFHRWSLFSDGRIDLNRPATRTEVVVTVLQAFSRTIEPTLGSVFTDVSSGHPHREAIETAALDGIISGYTDTYGVPTGKFGPFDHVNRAEIAKIITLAIQLYGE